jgi:hypothetical protein
MHRQQQRFCATSANWLQRQSSSLSALCDSFAAAATSSTSATSATPMLINANAISLFSNRNCAGIGSSSVSVRHQQQMVSATTQQLVSAV